MATVAELVDALPKLADADRGFAASLISQASRRALSEKQMMWVAKLVERATAPDTRPVESVGNLTGLMGLFGKAKKHLKHPKITLQVDGRPVQMKVGGERSKYRGSVLLTDGGRFGSNEWYGHVTPEGEWVQPRNLSDERRGALGALLKAMSVEPERTASEYGRLTGNCCFCCRPLSDERSTAVGYGKVCADHFGLKWGSK